MSDSVPTPRPTDVISLREKRDRKLALAVTAAVHLALLVGFAFVTVLPALVSEPEIRAVVVAPAAVETPTIRKQETARMASRVAAAPAASSAMAHVIQSAAPAPIAVPSSVLPEVDSPVGLGAASGLGVAQGAFGGLGSGVSGSSFFGQRAQARRVAYVITYAGSMMFNQAQHVMRDELARSIRQTPPGSQFAVILFAGPVWLLGEDPQEIRTRWERDAETRTWRLREGQLPVARWIPASPDRTRTAAEQVMETPLIHGTDWMTPLQVALSMTPAPEVIYFMTDGEPDAQNIPEVVAMVRARRGQTRINVVGIRLTPWMETNLAWLASAGRGQFTVIQADGSVAHKDPASYDLDALEQRFADRLRAGR